MLEFGCSIERTPNSHMTMYNFYTNETNANNNSNFFVHKKPNNIYFHYLSQRYSDRLHFKLMMEIFGVNLTAVVGKFHGCC